MKKNLKTLDADSVNKIAHKVEYWRTVLLDAQSTIFSGANISLLAEKDAYEHFKKWLTVENSILAQKSRIKWLSKADDCTKFFHTVMKEQKCFPC